MLFAEPDAPVLKAWIVKRLETPSRSDSDVDADVLADYVLALLRHDGDAEDVRKLCEKELEDFLKEESAPFVKDVFQAVTYKSYLPGAPPPPPFPTGPAAEAVQPTSSSLLPPPPAGLPGSATIIAPPTGPHGYGSLYGHPNGSRKRGFYESSLYNENDPSLSNLHAGPHAPYGGRSFKQPRRGGSFRGGRGRGGGVGGAVYPGRFPEAPSFADGMYGQPGSVPLPPPPVPLLPLPPYHHHHQQQQQQQPGGVPAMDPLIQMQMMYSGYGRPFAASAPGPRYAGRRCREFAKKGYCSRRGCKFEHDPIPIGPMDPNGAAAAAGDPASVAAASAAAAAAAAAASGLPFPPPFPMLPTTTPTTPATPTVINPYPRRRNARAVISADGPIYDMTKSTVVVEGIPDEHLNEEAVRNFFAQFGNIEKLTLNARRKLAVVKYDSWAAANAAYHSPKVIFDNRFVKVYWYKEEVHGNGNAKGSSSNGNGRGKGAEGGVEGSVEDGAEGQQQAADAEAAAAAAYALEMEEFRKRQEEAQKQHEEKAAKKQQVEQQKQELEKRQKELLSRQLEERQRLVAKMAAAARKKREEKEREQEREREKEKENGMDVDVEGERLETDGGDVDNNHDSTMTDKDKAAAKQTEMIRAQLAALEEEAKLLGLDPQAPKGVADASGGIDSALSGVGGSGVSNAAPPSWRGGRGGGYRGRGGYYRGRGGGVGGGGNNSAYAAYSLDNRPRNVAVVGVDFSVPAQDEALRQFLLGIGDFVAIDTTPDTTTITFTDRRTAEKFYYGLATEPNHSAPTDDATAVSAPPKKRIPGIDTPVELRWVAGAPNGGNNSSATDNNGSIATNNAAVSLTNAVVGDTGDAVGLQGSKDESKAADDGHDVFMDADTTETNKMDSEQQQQQQQQQQQHDLDFDVAGGDDWGIM